MRYKRFISSLLACMLLFGCYLIPTEAVNADTFINSGVPLRVSGRLNHKLPANEIILITQSFSAEKGDTIKYDCTYTPKSASVDFGFIAPDDLFYSIKCTSGSINKTIELDVTGQYTLAIRNNESYAVTVTGTVKY